jgi:high-affinity Fe2+/Pb2+ permease
VEVKLRKEQVKEELTTFRDDNKNAFVVVVALATGSVTVVYQALIGNITPGFALLGIFGGIIVLPILSWISRNREKIETLIEELGELE